MKRIAVLGRGQSLSIYRDYAKLFKKIYIVGNFNKEIYDVGIGSFRGKEIVHVAARKGKTSLKKKLYKELKIKRVQSCAFKTKLIENKDDFGVKLQTMPEYMKTRGYPPVGWDNIMSENYDAPLRSPNKRCWPTSGLTAIDLALVENNPDEIYLFGFDFYQKPYLSSNQTCKKEPAKVEMMHIHLQKLINEYDKTKFKCSSNISMFGDNWGHVTRDEKRWHNVDLIWLLNKQIKVGRYNRMDIFARYLAIEAYYGKNSFGWKLYHRMQYKRLWNNFWGAKKARNDFCKLIGSIREEGYKYIKPVRVDWDWHLINGAHRLAAALYHYDKLKDGKVFVRHDDAKKKNLYNIKWFRKNGIPTKWSKQIEKKGHELSRKWNICKDYL